MDTQKLTDLVDQLDDNIDDLEEQLEPLLSAAFSATTKKLPVLDRAKLYVLVTYTIESLLFSYIRLHGQDAKEHPVFKELSRVRLYFEKIKEAENGGPTKRENLSLNKEAAGRMIKHGLSGNDKYDRERAAREATEQALASAKLRAVPDRSNPRKRIFEAVDGAEVNPKGNAPDSADVIEDQASTAPSTPRDESSGKKNKESTSQRRERKHKAKHGGDHKESKRARKKREGGG